MPSNNMAIIHEGLLIPRGRMGHIAASTDISEVQTPCREWCVIRSLAGAI